MKRPKFDERMERIQPGDTIAVTKLDRFARTAADGSTLIQQLLDKGVKVHVLNMWLIDDSPIGKVIVNVLLAFAQFERDLIVERTQAGKSIARTRAGFREGRPPIPAARKAAAVRMVLNPCPLMLLNFDADPLVVGELLVEIPFFDRCRRFH